MRKIKQSDSVRMLSYFKGYKTILIILSITMLIGCFIEILNPIFMANVLNSITDFNSNNALFYSSLLLIVSVAAIVNNHLINRIYFLGFKKPVLLNIRKDMIKNILDMKVENFDIHSTGEFSERLKNDPETISMIISSVQWSVLNLVADFFAFVYIFYISYILGIIYLIGVLLIFLYEKYAFKKQEKLFKELKTLQDNNATVLNETVRGIRDIKLLNIINPIYNLTNRSLSNATDASIKKGINRQNLWDIVEIIKRIIRFAVLVCGIFLIKKDLLSATNLVIIYMYNQNVFDMILCYTTIKEQLVEFKVSASRIFELMDENKFSKETFGNKELVKVNGKIEFKNVSFSYDDKKVLDDVSFKLEPNDTVGIVGASGSGKTTLLNLLVKGYYVPDNKIFIDDIDINDLTRDSIRDNISIITQNPYLFNLTIRENFELMGDNIKKKDIVEACKIAQIHDYIESLPDKYDTILGEGGINLSGGQKQRLAIARALLKKSKIILMDEATSALDNITQNELQKAINNITKDYTIIIVAHRLSTIKECSRIYVVDNGKIVGVGTHDELLKKNKYYKKLYKEELV